MARPLALGLLAVCALGLTPGAGVSTQARDAAQPLLDSLAWRHIGPAAFGGRIDDIEAVPDQPWIIFVGAASGGVFKSVNNGVTWRPVFDNAGGMLSVGDIAIAPSDPNIVWVGSGEPNSRQSSSWGDGVYRSLDGGETWTHMGLKDSQAIGRVVIHPRNPDVVFVAAMGHLWGPNDERGLYRSRDAGKTWEQVLKIDKDTGVVDVAIDADGRTLFAGAYQRRRRAWGFDGGGPGSGVYRSLDGGSTWQKLANGLPTGPIGRIGLAISQSDPRVVYALVEHKTQGGVYRSTDRGATWTRQGSTNPRPMYYSQVRIDPVTPDKIWVLGTQLHASIDAGKTFRTDTGDKIHVDHHALWIDPRNPDHMMLGNDGGLHFTYDGTKTWDVIDNLPIGQYYDIGTDNRDPYWVYGGAQDNGTWAVPSRTNSLAGIMNRDVVNIAYGDGFFTQPDPTDPKYVYANSQSGRTYLVHLDSFEEKGIRPVPLDAKEKYRFNWSTPLLVSRHNPKVVYYGGNKLFRTEDRGHVWREISPDLSKNEDWKKLPIMGERNDDTLSRDDGVSDFGTITTIGESPLQAGLLYIGTDDGQVQMTKDEGKSWQNITSRFKLPGARWVSRVLPSQHAASTAYVSFDGHNDDDFAPYVFRTTDGGATWTSVTGDLPGGVVVNSLAEYPKNAQVLLAGTESGLYFTIDGGKSWARAGGNLPRVPVDDIVVEERSGDIVLGTHGRSIIILDDARLLEQLTPATLTSDLHLFATRPAQPQYQARMLPPPGASEFSGDNLPPGALITYYLKDEVKAPAAPAAGKAAPSAGATSNGSGGGASAAEPAKTPAATGVTIAISDASGKTVREIPGTGRKGLNRVAWDLRAPLSFTPADSDDGWFGIPMGPAVPPGTYTVKVSAAGKTATGTVQVSGDARMNAGETALKARYELSQSLNALLGTYAEASSALERLQKELQRARDAVAANGTNTDATKAAIDDFAKKVDGMKEKFGPSWGGPRFTLLDVYGQLQASSSAPTEAQVRARDQMGAALREDLAALNVIITKDLPALQSALASAGVTGLVTRPVAVPK